MDGSPPHADCRGEGVDSQEKSVLAHQAWRMEKRRPREDSGVAPRRAMSQNDIQIIGAQSAILKRKRCVTAS